MMNTLARFFQTILLSSLFQFAFQTIGQQTQSQHKSKIKESSITFVKGKFDTILFNEYDLYPPKFRD